MSDKRSKNNTTKNNKASKNRKILTLRLNSDDEIPEKTAYIKDTECFRINDVDINNIRVSDKKLYNKEHNSYKYYVFYEHNYKYIPLKIILRDVVGYHNDYKDNSKYDSKYSANRMNFKLDDDSLDKSYDIFEYIEKKLKTDLDNFTYESKGEKYLKTVVSDEACFRKDNKTNTIPNENTKYNCRVLLQVQSVYHSLKVKDDIKYYSQLLIEQCGYRVFSNNVLIIQILFLQILNQILNQMIMMNLKKRLMKMLYLLNKNNTLIAIF